jgi:HD-GYP domain-containing protein (c-di-GMP phosphodiesterase class II)
MELVSTADANLYQSKTNGGNQITARGTTPTDNSLVYVKGFDLFRAMVAAIDNKDGYTRKHSEEVTAYSLEIAKAMQLGDDMLQTIQVSGLLHDVGKIGVPDHILRKPGHLSDDEFQVMQQHPVFGALIVGAIPGMEQVVLGVRHHHERFDGRGYPDRLGGDQIPLIGRIMAVGDAYSAMRTTRPYRKGLTERQALAEIQKGLGTQFDPEIGALFIKIREGNAPGDSELSPTAGVPAPKSRSRRKPEPAESAGETPAIVAPPALAAG